MIRSGLMALALGLTALPVLTLPAAAQDAPAQTGVPGLDRDALRAEIRAYLLDNPEVIYEAIQELEKRRKAASASAEQNLVRDNAAALFDDGYSNVDGNPDGKLTLVEFFDYRCGYCKRAHDDVQKLVREDGDIRFIRKEFPILGPDSLLASRAALAAQLQGDPEVYLAFSNAMMEFGGPLTDTTIDRLADRAGVDVERMHAEMESDEVNRRLQSNHALAQALQIGGTPTFIIGETIVRGYLPYEDMARAIDDAHATLQD
ncbi:DsbA family protein [Paroceanicella profunda]|uniref:DsbA family protein n=1 Tax=Paroceanicella profunda TaxID=2579971 RepID=A0A5B8FID6_9RHOB|nr:DsbA family protein [Paroceanicella profunda]QDL92968.1 DsbA family protein [Paroceanicella profunda]